MKKNNLVNVLTNDVIVISINSQGLRDLMKEIVSIGVRNKTFILCMKGIEISTGMRLSELVGLNMESFDSEITTVKVIGKGNKERIIYLNSAAHDAVLSYLRIRLDPKYVRTGTNALFLSRLETRISQKTVQWMVYKYLDMAGLGDRHLSVHKLRHTAATLMYQHAGVDVRVLKEILGHEQLNTTQIYTHISDEQMENAMEKNPLSQFKTAKKEDRLMSALSQISF